MFKSIDEIRKANEAIGHHFFDDDSMAFFGSKVYPTVYGGRYFVTSEKRPRSSDPRGYTIREAQEDGDIVTVGDFQQFATLNAARRAAIKLEHEVDGVPTYEDLVQDMKRYQPQEG